MKPTVAPINYRNRLEEVCRALQGGSLLLLAQPESNRNSTVENAYRQDANLFYFTGFTEPDSALLILSHRPEGQQFILFAREKNFNEELWTGLRLGIDAAKKSIPVDDVFPIKDLWEKLPALLGGTKEFYFDLGYNEVNDRKVISALGAQRRSARRTQDHRLSVVDPNRVTGPIRHIKKAEEIERMKCAAAITAKTFENIYAKTRPGMTEKDVYGIIMGEFLLNGADMEAYGSIVAAGKNACVLHYRDNVSLLKDGELLLIDAGSQFEYYASDVTRTFPIGKKFSAVQKDLYAIVLASQKRAIETAIPGSDLVKVHDVAVEILVSGLLDMKLMTGSKSEIIEKQTYKKFYPHGTSHWIGLDVHDQGNYLESGAQMKLKPGMFFSVEPGIYIDPSYTDVPAEFPGIGIRIEDDVLVTSGGNLVLTNAIAKEIKDLEDRF